MTNENKKVLIIGGGISGLSAGVYAAKSGFDVTILEQHSTFGGLSTGWSRKGYFFEGGMHWLTGSSPKLVLNRVWRETGALKENNPIENRDPYYTLIDGDDRLYMYRDVDKLRRHLTEYAPEDKKMIRRLCRDIKLFTYIHLPVNDIPGLKTKHHTHPSLPELIKMVPAGIRCLELTNVSYMEYVDRFKNKNIRHLLKSAIGYRYNATSLIYTLGSFASGDCGYPAGGSVRMAQNMLDTFTSCGGKILYRTKAEKVITENGITRGVKTKDGIIPADAVIVTQDTRRAIDTLFDAPVNVRWARKMRSKAVTEQNIFISAGVRADLSHLPCSMIFPLKKPFEFAGNSWTELRINNYAAYSNHAPEGGTSLTCLLLGASYDFWKKAKEDGTYRHKKDELGRLFVETASEFIPQIKECLEVIDVATPCTYERYCGSHEGSWMSVWGKGGAQLNYPQTAKGIKGTYFAGQRILMPGGLPIAVYTGRQAVQLLCRDTGTEFKS